MYVARASEKEGKLKQATGEKNRWILFDREVESPHTTSFYVEAPGEASAYDQAAFTQVRRSLRPPQNLTTNETQAAQYWYNGEERPARTFNSEMDLARQVIGPLVQTALAGRSVRTFPTPFRTSANVPSLTLSNTPVPGSPTSPPPTATPVRKRFARPLSPSHSLTFSQSVGWHSDVLTYLGPFPTIASLSLGVSRPFRLRSSSGLAPRTLSIPLPHNALLIMHAGTQERFRHCVPPVGAVDLWRVPRGLGIDEERGFKERINVRSCPSLSPSPSSLNCPTRRSLSASTAPTSPPSPPLPPHPLSQPSSLPPTTSARLSAPARSPASCAPMPKVKRGRTSGSDLRSRRSVLRSRRRKRSFCSSGSVMGVRRKWVGSVGISSCWI